MTKITDTERAQITAMVLRVVNELAGGDPGLDRPVAEVLSGVIEICHCPHVKCSPKVAQAAMQAGLDLATDNDWLLTVKKTGTAFEFEAKFGANVKTATLRESAKWLAEAEVIKQCSTAMFHNMCVISLHESRNQLN
jgi:hypothetical protein